MQFRPHLVEIRFSGKNAEDERVVLALSGNNGISKHGRVGFSYYRGRRRGWPEEWRH